MTYSKPQLTRIGLLRELTKEYCSKCPA